MRAAPNRPRLGQLFVCTHRREPGDPLGAGCAGAGDSLHAALADDLARRGLRPSLWLARTHCLGLCPREGAAVAFTPDGDWLVEATAADAAAIVDRAARR